MKKFIPYIIGLLLVVGLGFLKYQLSFAKEDSVETVSSNSSHSVDNTKEAERVVVSDYSEDIPEVSNGTLKAVIELGSQGFNMFVINYDASKNYEVKVKKFGKSLALEGFLTANDVKNQLKEYIQIASDNGVQGKNIHFVISSGALKNKDTKLISSEVSKMGYVVNEISPEIEGKYAYNALLKVNNRYNSNFCFDLGSGNGKLNYHQDGRIVSFETPGAKYFSLGISDSEAMSKVKNALENVPTSLRNKCYVIGGVPYSIYKKMGCTGRFCKLDLASFSPEDKKEEAGLAILKEVEKYSPDGLIFDVDANFSIGFLLK